MYTSLNMPAVEHSFPSSVVFAPRSGVHKHTIILLHGRGGSAETFSQRLLHTPLQRSRGSQPPTPTTTTTTTTTLPEAFPDAKFIFPCARRQRATVYKRSVVRQWFDDWHVGPAPPSSSSDVVDARYDDGLQTTGLGEAAGYLRGLLAEEAKLVRSGRDLVIGGFSQGAATSLVTAMLWDGREPLGGVVAMAGWLPYTKQLTDMSSRHPSDRSGDGDSGNDQDEAEADLFADPDPFERPVSRGRTKRHLGDCQPAEADHAALDWLVEEIEFPGVRLPCLCSLDGNRTPAILCHGALDKQVEHQRGEQACLILPKLGLYPVSWNLYQGIVHDYTEAMLSDVMRFLQQILP